jgi:hypothetical protein
MRKTWIAIAMIALLVGLVAGYRAGRTGKPPQVSKLVGAVTESASEPATESKSGGVPTSQAPALAGSTREDGESRPSTIAEDERAAPSSGAATAAPPRPPSSEAAAPEVAVSAVLPFDPTQGRGAASPPAARVVQPTILDPATAPPAVPAPPAAPTPAAETPPAAATQDAVKEPENATESEDRESDRRPPVLQSLLFNPPETRGGGTVTLSIGSVDDLSGVKLVYGSVRSPSGSASLPFSAREASGAGVFVTTLVIPAQAETGEWFVASLQIVDKADNTLALVFARATVPEGGALRVVSDDSDSKPPDVSRVFLVKGSVDAGESNQIVVDVVDDRSGVALVMGAFQSPSKAAFIPFNCAPGSGSSWEGDVPVPVHADCGEWTLRQLRVVDKANNSVFLAMDAPQIGHVGFVVSGGGACDSEPPVVDHFYVAPTIVSNAAAADVVLTIGAHDDASGVASISGWIEGPVATNGQSPRMPFAATSDPRDPEAPMIARITVPQFAAQGIWRVTIAQVSDKARNTRTYNRDDPALREAHFTVE